ncbi:MAG: cation diffusion facilitator family transporter [Myxococcota bacterium]|nr:cation diffusion facilitator family transporter [Myxococcota bacterium]
MRPDTAKPVEHDHPHHTHGNGHAHRAASKKALWGALVILGVFFVVELIGGIASGSLALLSDAVHLLTDVAAVGLALFAQWMATRPPSATKSYGYRRAEIMAALLNGLTLWVIAVFICIEAFERLFDPPQIAAEMMLIVAAAGAVAQTFTAIILAKASGESLNVRGAYVHALTDAVQSLGVVGAGIAIMLTGVWIVDPIVSIGIGLLIIWSGGKIVFEATHILLEGTPTDIDLTALAAAMREVAGVAAVTDLHAWSLTSGFNALSAHVVADPTIDAAGREEIARCLNDMLRNRYAIHHSTIQVEKSCTMTGKNGCSEWIGS